MRSAVLLLATLALLPATSASPNVCEDVGTTNVCLFTGTYEFSEDCAQSQVGVFVFTPQGRRGAWVDNGCYEGSSEWGPYEGTFIGASYDDGQAGDGFRRVHLNTGTGSTPNGEEAYCHAGIFNEQYQYTRLVDCPPLVGVPSALPAVLALLP